MPDDPVSYPEHDKMRAVKHDAAIIGEFLEWLTEGGVTGPEGETVRLWTSIERLLAEYFNVNLTRIAEEKDQMLEVMRRHHEKSPSSTGSES